MPKSGNPILFVSKAVKTLSDWVNRVAEWICIVCGMGIVISITIAVFTRYIMSYSFIWPEEVARFLMIWITFIGGSIALKRKGLVSFQFLLDTLPQSYKRFFDLGVKIGIITFVIAFLYYGKICLELYKRVTALGTHMSYFWPALGMMIGGAFMLIQSLQFLIDDICILMDRDRPDVRKETA